MRRHGSARFGWRPGEPDRLELLTGPLRLALPLEVGGQQVAHRHEQLDVEGRVDEPVGGQGTVRPVRRAVALAQPDPEQPLGERPEADARVAREPPGELGVEQRVRVHAHLGEAGQVLGGGVQHPLDAPQRLPEHGEIAVDGDGVDERRPRALAAELDEVRAGRVPEPRRPLGVQGDRSGPRGHRLGERGERTAVGDQIGNALGRGQEVDHVVHVGLRVALLALGRRPGVAGVLDRAQRMTPARMASATIWARSPVPSLRPMRER